MPVALPIAVDVDHFAHLAADRQALRARGWATPLSMSRHTILPEKR